MRPTLWIAFLACGHLFAAEGFDFPDFKNCRGLILLENARCEGKSLSLTAANQFQVGAVWNPVKQFVRDGFETSFTFQFSNQDLNEGGADGLAFVLQSQSDHAIGGFGGSGGFLRNDNGAPGGMRPGIIRMTAIYFDTYRNAWDDSDNSVSLYVNGPSISPRWPPHALATSRRFKVNLKDGKRHTARIVYAPPVLTVFLDSAAEPVFATPMDVTPALDAEGKAWVGFTSSTGGSFEDHDLLNWHFEGRPRPDTSSTMTSVDSRVAYRKDTAVVEEKSPGLYHVVLPANIEWGTSVPNPEKAAVRVFHVTGTVCWAPRVRESGGCNGPEVNGHVPGEADTSGFVNPRAAVGSLVVHTLNGAVWFSVNDRSGAFADNEGYFEFDVELRK